jgi:AcrR family transcriptional regulator
MDRQVAEPRPYLRAGARRTQLLDAAAAIVGRDGLGNLTIAGVGAEAGVSRQWVYGHFSDLDDLYRSLILDRFAALEASIDAAEKRLNRQELVVFGARQVFGLGSADRRILRCLVDGTGWNSPELAGIGSELRERIFGRWTGFVRELGHDETEARAIVWAVVNALFGLADQIEREPLALERAVDILKGLVGAFDTPHHAREGLHAH